MQFDRFANDYKSIMDGAVAVSGEESGYFSEYKARYLQRLLTPAFSGRVLDFGCGVGLLSGYIKQLFPGAVIDGFDVSNLSIQQVDPALRSQGIFTSSLFELPNDYSLIVVANVMHHISSEQRQNVINGLAERLVSAGMVAIFEHNPANPITRWIVEKCPFDADAVLLPPAETVGYLSNSGLVAKRRDYIVFMPKLLAWLRPLESWLGWLPMGAQYAIVGEKV